MSHDNVYIKEISRLKKMVVMRTCWRILLIALGIFLFICIVTRGLERTGIALTGGQISFYLLSGAISLAISLLQTYLKRKSFSHVLQDLDQRLNLKDRVSTAYEYQMSGKKSELLELLLQDAAYHLRLLRKRDIFPPKFSWFYLLFAILLLVNIGLYSVDRVVSASNHKAIDQKTLAEIRTRLQVYTKRKTTDIKTVKKTPHRNVYKKLANIAAKTENRSMTREQLLSSMHKVLKEVQGEHARAVKALGEKLDDIGIEDIALQRIYQLENLSASELKKLKMLLDKMFGNQIPESVKEDMAILDEHHNLEKFLSQMIDVLNEMEVDPADAFDSDAAADQRIAQKQKDSQKSDESEGGSANRSGRSGSNRDPNRKPGATTDREGDGKEWDEFGGNYSSQAGNARAADIKMSPYDIEKAKGPTIKDKTMSPEAENYYVHIRSLSSIGKTNVKEEDITRPYRQEIESILQKEDIPLNYREYIKNYFISIGLRTERNRHDKPR